MPLRWGNLPRAPCTQARDTDPPPVAQGARTAEQVIDQRCVWRARRFQHFTQQAQIPMFPHNIPDMAGQAFIH
jgi:hypothetical protein